MRASHLAGTLVIAVSGTAMVAVPGPPSAEATPLFSGPAFHSVGDLPFDVASGDLDGDGDHDLVVANVLSEDISILMNDGVGHFLPQVRRAIGKPARAVALGDLNGDGYADIAVARQQAAPTLVVLHANGTGGFSAPIPVGTFAGFPDDVRILHVDDDDRADIVVGSPSSGVIAVFLNTGAAFDQDTYPTGTAPAYPSDLAAGDLDGGDGPDFVVSAALSPTLQPSCSTMATARSADIKLFSELIASPVSVDVGDVNGDGSEDIAMLESSGATVHVHPNDGTASFGPADSYPVGTTTQSGGRVRLADFDGDGWLDAVVTPFLSNPVAYVLLGDQLGGLGTAVPYAAGHGSSAIAIADLDGDSDLDLAVTSKDDDVIAILMNQSAATSDVEGLDPSARPDFWLGAARPNPARGSSSIAFRLPRATHVGLGIFDLRGRLVRVLVDGDRAAGLHRVGWDGLTSAGRISAPGLYLVRMEAGTFHATGKLSHMP